MEARLEGGPFDGAVENGIQISGPPPGEVGAWICPSCGEIHIDPDAPNGSERYRFDREEGRSLVYVYRMLNLSPSDDREKELVGA